jgi:hypothetical protein
MSAKPLILFSLLGCLSGAVNATEVAALPEVGVEIIADDGSVFARYDLADRSQRGRLRAYLEAEHGRNYGIRVHNRTGGRIGLVIAVDGRNILSGDKSHLRSSEPMYVLGPYQHATYRGWRTSDTRVHRFFFTDVESSYAEAWGDRSAMGVIAVAAFREMPQVQQRHRSGRPSSPSEPARAGESQSSKSTESADAANAPGTGFGDGRYSRSVRVHFEPERHAFVQQFLKYEWRHTLVKLGIVRETPPRNRFWPEHIEQAQSPPFAPYPPGYRNRRP